jgi:PQQ-like domain
MPALSLRIRKLAAVTAVIIGGAGGAVAGPAWPAPATTAPHVTLSPGSGPPTSKVTVSGAGFGAHKAVDIYLDTTDEALASTNASGSFSHITITVPASAVPGKHWVTAIQRPSGPSAQAAFTVRTNWSQFRYSGTHTGSNPFENVLSPANVAAIDQAWSYPTGADLAYSSPAVVNGVLYAGSDSGNVYALNAATSAKLWSYIAGDGVDSSPAVVNGVVYVSSLDGNLHAFRLPGGLAMPPRPSPGNLHPNVSLRTQRP